MSLAFPKFEGRSVLVQARVVPKPNACGRHYFRQGIDHGPTQSGFWRTSGRITSSSSVFCPRSIPDRRLFNGWFLNTSLQALALILFMRPVTLPLQLSVVITESGLQANPYHLFVRLFGKVRAVLFVHRKVAGLMKQPVLR